jgi:acyl-coenzyme A synthetase/AMP-(fatty) acid ligase
MVVTTPLYIKALNKINETKNLSKSLFISSTAPLESKSAKEFVDKFSTNIIQLFGSTETGGIAFKNNYEENWTPLQGVEISQNNLEELRVKSPFVSNELYDGRFEVIDGVMQTFDFIEIIEDKFRLVGRSSKILKIAGKRYSTVQIENILEDMEEIKHALVFVRQGDSSFKDEILDITLESKKEFSSSEIKKILKSKLSNLKFSIALQYVDEIPTNEIGKKLLIKNVS